MIAGADWALEWNLKGVILHPRGLGEKKKRVSWWRARGDIKCNVK